MTGPPPDWREVLRVAMHKTGIPADVIRRTFTLPEIEMALDDSTDRKAPRGRDAGPTDPEEAARWFKGLTARQRLNLARHGEAGD